MQRAKRSQKISFSYLFISFFILFPFLLTHHRSRLWCTLGARSSSFSRAPHESYLTHQAKGLGLVAVVLAIVSAMYCGTGEEEEEDDVGPGGRHHVPETSILSRAGGILSNTLAMIFAWILLFGSKRGSQGPPKGLPRARKKRCLEVAAA